MRRLALFLVSAVLAAVPVAAGDAGTASGEMLQLGLGARPLAMGGSYVAISDDLNAGQYNPAGIGAVRQYAVDTHYSDLYEGLTYGGISVGIPAPKRTTLGLSYSVLDSGNIPKTIATNRGLFIQDSGSFKVKDTLMAATLGSAIYAPFEIGIGIKRLSESIDGVKGTGTMLDAGVILNLGSRFRIGVAGQNIGGELNFPDQKEEVSKTLSGGAAVRLLSERNFTISADACRVDTGGTGIRVGTEYTILQNRRVSGGSGDVQSVYERVPFLSLRAGYDSEAADDLGSGAGVSFGAGFHLGFVRLDYALVDVGDFGLTHRVSLGFSFGRNKTDVRPDDMDMSPRRENEEERRAVPADKTKGGRYKLR